MHSRYGFSLLYDLFTAFIIVSIEMDVIRPKRLTLYQPRYEKVLAQQMREVTRQIAGLTNELESLLPRDRYIRDRPTNASPAGCSDDDENWRSQGDEIASKSLATGSCFPTNLVILPGGSTVDENRNRAGA